MGLATLPGMDTSNASLINFSAPTAGPSPAPAEAPPEARADGSAPGRSFAATLANAQPPAGDASGSSAAQAGQAAQSSQAAQSAPARSNAPASDGETSAPDAQAATPKASKPPAKAGSKAKAATGGGNSPADGKALPLPAVLVAPIIASPPTPATATTVTNAVGTAVAPADATAAAAGQLAAQSAADGEKAGQHDPREVAATPELVGAAIPALSEPATPVATSPAPTQAAAGPASMDASLAKALAQAVAGTPSGASAGQATHSTGVVNPTRAVDSGAAPPPAALAPAPVAAKSLAASPAATPTVTLIGAPAPKPARAPAATSTANATTDAAPAADAAADMPPVSTELRSAITALLATSTKSEVTATTSGGKAALDTTGTVMPTLLTAPTDRTAAPTTVQVSTPVGAPTWATELSDRVNVLVNQNLTQAQIKLSPADLGPIEVRIALVDGQANVSFTTHSHVTSEALQAAAPKLREALGSQGYTSVNVDVAQQQFRERTTQQSRYEPEPAFGAPVASARAVPAARAGGVAGTASRLDAYA